MRRTLSLALLALISLTAGLVAGCGDDGKDAAKSGQEPVLAAGGSVPIPRPPDSDAPPGSPPHWLPADHWVHHHYTPFDEVTLYKLLGTSRDGMWEWLRDDNRTIEQLAARKGYDDVGTFSDLLLASRADEVSPEMLDKLRSRTLRLLRQGHLAQHVLFHSLHQESGPDAARRLFGVTTTEFQSLRRLDIGPLQIGRRHGRTRAQMQKGLEGELKMAVDEGIEGGDMSRRQGMTLLRRQLRQVPRWLGEEHYNGPPQTVGGKPKYPFRASFSSPALSGDGATVLFDSAQPAPPLAVKFGEVNLGGRDVKAGAALNPRDTSAAARADAPCSSFNPSVSGDGQTVAYELSAGNRTFAKRYGNVVIALGDLRAGTLRRVAGGKTGKTVTTAYDPSVSDDGSVVAYVMVAADPMAATSDAATRIGIYNAASGKTTLIPRAGAYEPAVSADGRHVAFTAFAKSGGLQAWVYDRKARTVRLVSRGAAEAWAPSISGDGSRVAYAAATTAGGRSRIWVRDLDEAKPKAVTSTSRDFVDSPSLSSDGTVVAYARELAGSKRSAPGRPLQQVVVRPAAGGPPETVSSASAWSGQPQLSDNGEVIAFTTDDGTPPTGPCGLRVMLHGTKIAMVSPKVAATTFDGGTASLDPGKVGMCDLRSPAW